jgi:hypothetical protein
MSRDAESPGPIPIRADRRGRALAGDHSLQFLDTRQAVVSGPPQAKVDDQRAIM